MTDALADLSAREIARRVRAGEITASEVLDQTLLRIQQVEGRSPTSEPYEPQPEDRKYIHAYVSLAEARASGAGTGCGPSHPRRARSGSLGGCAAGGQGHLLCRGDPLDCRIENPGNFHSALHRHPGRSIGGGGCRDGGQGQSGRVHFRIVERVVGLSAAAR